MFYLYFIGIDISKDFFEVALNTAQNTVDKNAHNHPRTYRFTNDNKGFNTFITSLDHLCSEYFIVLEATGGYEHNLLTFLCQHSFAVHRLQTLKSSHYMRSLRVYGKNDVIDAEALARFGAERHDTLPIFILPCEDMLALQILYARRDDLVAMRTAEKLRQQNPLYDLAKEHPAYECVTQSIVKHCDFLDKQITQINKKMADIIDNNQDLSKKKKIMTEFKGIGEQTSCVLLAGCPELGTLSRKQIASLAGVAPHPKESGTYQGYRSTKGGRSQIKRALFMAALSAKRYHPKLKKFFDDLVARGKKKMVALTAVMRKMIVILNAQIRDSLKEKVNQNSQSQS